MRNNHKEVKEEDGTRRIVLSQEMSFLNKASLRVALDEIPEKSNVIIDGSESKFIDYDVLEIIHDYKSHADTRDIKVKLVKIPRL